MGNTNKAMETVLNLVHMAKHLEKGAFLDHSQLLLTSGENKTTNLRVFHKHTKTVLGRENRVYHI